MKQLKYMTLQVARGSLLLNIGQAVSKYIDDPNKIKYYAQEKKSIALIT